MAHGACPACAAAVFSGGVAACGGPGGSSNCNAILAGTTAGTYTVRVTGCPADWPKQALLPSQRSSSVREAVA